MDFQGLISAYGLVDVISMGDRHYALTEEEITLTGCTVVPMHRLHEYLPQFIAAGYSHRHGQAYSEVLGIRNWVLFSYSLAALPPSRKQVLNHMLTGSAGRRSLLAAWKGQKVGRSALLVPKESETQAIAFFTKWSVPYTAEVVLRGE